MSNVRIAPPRMAGRHGALGHFHQAAEQLLQLVAVDAQVGGLAHPLVEPGRAFGERELPGPHVRLRVGIQHEALRLDLRDGVGRRRLDPVDLARQQRRGAGAGLRHRQQDDAVDLRLALGIPVVVVLDVFHALARRELVHLERPRARSVGGEGGPRLLGPLGRIADAGQRVVLLLPVRRRGHEQVGQVDRDEAVRLLGGQLDRVVVDLARRHQVRHAADGDADLVGREVRRLLLEDLLDVPDDGIGLQVGAVMELHALAQLEDPLGLVGRIDGPFGGEARDQHARLVGRRQVPVREGVEQRNAGEAVALEALVRLPCGAGNVGGRHRHAENFLLRECRTTR